MVFALRSIGFTLVAMVLVGKPASAPATSELVHLRSGRTLAVSGYEFEETRVVLHLHGGGQVVCDRSLILRIEPGISLASSKQFATAVVPPLPPKPFAEIIDAASMRHGVNPALVSALIEVESAYRPDAVSPKGAMGLMQLMPDTAREYAVTDPYDPTANIEAGTRHLRALLDRYGVNSALAAYNAGEGPVQKFGGVPPYPETRRYITKIIKLVDAQNE